MDLPLIFQIDPGTYKGIHIDGCFPQRQSVMHLALEVRLHLPDIACCFHVFEGTKSLLYKIIYYYVLHGITFFIYLCIEHLLALAYIMKNIVLYTIMILGGILSSIMVNAQKPVIELIPVNRTLPPSEKAADTTSALRDQQAIRLIYDASTHPEPSVTRARPEPNEQRRTGMGLPSLFKKWIDVPEDRPPRPTGVPLFFKYIHPFQLFFQINAQK